jgi:hypothetical protein
VSNIQNLSGIGMTSGTAKDGPGKYRGFIHVRVTAENGDVLIGQLAPDEVREMALVWLSAAEAADQDRIVMTMLTRDAGLDEETALGFIAGMREERDKND